MALKPDRRSLTSAANGRKSRGPKTPEGKAISSRNSTRHGICAATLVLDTESTRAFTALLAEMYADFAPVTPAECAQVDNIAVCRWRQMRLWSIETGLYDSEIHRHRTAAEPAPPPLSPIGAAFRSLNDNSRTLELIGRFETRYDRQYSRALQRLRLLQARRENAKFQNEPDLALEANRMPAANEPAEAGNEPNQT